ncbi:MAG: hypothetical protein LUI87_00770 [Lachnospiraceae bacterium]|nr:hypothetical protein [Lachnospiraceae bacterium]
MTMKGRMLFGTELFRRKPGCLPVLFLTMLLAFCLTAVAASASESDRMPDIDSSQELSLTVTMTYTDPNLETDNVVPMSGVEVRLVQVASLAVNGGSADYTLLETFAGSEIELAGMNASESSEAAEVFADLATGRSKNSTAESRNNSSTGSGEISTAKSGNNSSTGNGDNSSAENGGNTSAGNGQNISADVKTATTDSEGKAVFTGLEAGMYLVFQEEGANTVYQVDAVMAILISVPYPQLTADGNSWIYAVETYPKTELSGPKNNGSITVTKEFYDTTADMFYYPPEDEEIVFYVGLFTDEVCTQQAEGTADLPITFLNSSSASVTFENLTTDRTYYIAETDGSGNVISSVTRNGVVFYADYPDGQAVTITRDETEASIRFRNTTPGLPDRYYYGGTLTITKQALYGEEDYVTTGTYYAGIFADAEFTTLAGDVVELKLENASSVSVDVQVYFGTEETDSVTCYVTETDENGTPLSNDSDLGFIVSLSKEGGMVTLNSENARDEIVIMNSFEKIEIETELETEPGWISETETESEAETEPTETEPAETEPKTESEPETESKQPPETESGQTAETNPDFSSDPNETEPETDGKTSVTSTPQTGDGTPLAMTIAIMAAALLILLTQLRRIWSRK